MKYKKKLKCCERQRLSLFNKTSQYYIESGLLRKHKSLLVWRASNKCKSNNVMESTISRFYEKEGSNFIRFMKKVLNIIRSFYFVFTPEMNSKMECLTYFEMKFIATYYACSFILYFLFSIKFIKRYFDIKWAISKICDFT